MSQEGCHRTEPRFSAEYTREAVAMLESLGVTVNQIAAELGRIKGVGMIFSLLDLYRFYLLLPRGRVRWSLIRVSNESLPPSRYITLGEWSRLPSTARVERAHSDRARSASKEGTWPPPFIPFQSSSQKTLVVPICSSISLCKCLAPACQSSVV